MQIQIVDPTQVSDWDSRLLEAREVDIFHSSHWAKVLKESYRYLPIFFTASENGQLSLSLPLMEIRSVWTGKRGCSLPFTDQCVPFFLERKTFHDALDKCIDHGRKAGWRYIEIRASNTFRDASPWRAYFDHVIHLSRDETDLFARLAPNNKRNIRKAIREGLAVEIGTSWDDVASFCRLNFLTRKRHGLPPQPLLFFKKVYEHIISTGCGSVISARYGRKIIASSIYFHFGNRALFKYGASANGYHHMRPNNLIMWEAIRWCKEHNFETLSLGRTELDNPGLLRYKRTWGALEQLIEYFRYNIQGDAFMTQQAGRASYTKLFTKMPTGMLRIIGRIAYRHMG